MTHTTKSTTIYSPSTNHNHLQFELCNLTTSTTIIIIILNPIKTLATIIINISIIRISFLQPSPTATTKTTSSQSSQWLLLLLLLQQQLLLLLLQQFFFHYQNHHSSFISSFSLCFVYNHNYPHFGWIFCLNKTQGYLYVYLLFTDMKPSILAVLLFIVNNF